MLYIILALSPLLAWPAFASTITLDEIARSLTLEDEARARVLAGLKVNARRPGLTVIFPTDKTVMQIAERYARLIQPRLQHRLALAPVWATERVPQFTGWVLNAEDQLVANFRMKSLRHTADLLAHIKDTDDALARLRHVDEWVYHLTNGFDVVQGRLSLRSEAARATFSERMNLWRQMVAVYRDPERPNWLLFTLRESSELEHGFLREVQRLISPRLSRIVLLQDHRITNVTKNAIKGHDVPPCEPRFR